MAERRMFAKTIIDSDAFLDMPLSTQALYFHLSMRADDDGFINNPKKIQRMIGCSEDDLKLLIAKNFIIPFESGIVVIKHWRIHNIVQKDRYKETVYQDEKSMLDIKQNKAYTLAENHKNELDIHCIQNVSKMETQDRIDKDRLGYISIYHIKEDEEEAADSAIVDNVDNFAARLAKDYNLVPNAVYVESVVGTLDGIDQDRCKLLEYACKESTVDRERNNWRYIDGIMQNLEKYGIKNMDELMRHEWERRGAK